MTSSCLLAIISSSNNWNLRSATAMVRSPSPKESQNRMHICLQIHYVFCLHARKIKRPGIEYIIHCNIYTAVNYENKTDWSTLSSHKDPVTAHDDVIKWKHFPCHWPFVRGIHRSPVNSPHKGQWREAFMFSLICARINDWINNREADDSRRHHAHYDVTVKI